MTEAEPLAALAKLVGSLRTALTIFAVMVLITGAKLSEDVTWLNAARAQRMNALAWTLLGFAVLSYSPLHALWSFGHPAPQVVARTGDILATSLSIGAFMILLAARGTVRGLSRQRVHRGVIANLIVLVGTVGVTWIIS